MRLRVSRRMPVVQQIVPSHPDIEMLSDMIEEPEICEHNGCASKPGEERHLIYGAVWCAACADDEDQYDKPEDFKAQRGVRE
jgi:hypothetical protein